MFGSNGYYPVIDLYKLEITALAKLHNVNEKCAEDIWVFRKKYPERANQESIAELIRLHNAGTPPNLVDFWL